MAPLVRGRRNIVEFFLLRQRLPLLLPARIAPRIVRLGEKIEDDVGRDQSHENTVSSLVPRRVIYGVLCQTRAGKVEGTTATIPDL